MWTKIVIWSFLALFVITLVRTPRIENGWLAGFISEQFFNEMPRIQQTTESK